MELSSREVIAPGARRAHRLTPKAIGVLRVLATNAGAVVTRDQLLAEVWPGTMPTNDVLTQAITQLRKAFSAGGDGSVAGAEYIETIAKSGYRLRAPVEWESSQEPASVHAPTSGVESNPDVGELSPDKRRRRRRKKLLMGIGVLLMLSCLVMAALLLRPSTERPDLSVSPDGTRVVGSPERPYRIITSSAGFETSPSISPDGTLVAYATERDGRSSILLQTTANAAAAPLVETPEGYSDRFPAWSPDGRQIAFARFGAAGSCEVLIAGATGGIRGAATRCDGTDMLSFDWAPDGKQLIFGSMSGRYAHHGIRLFEIVSGRWKRLNYQLLASDFDYAPRFSPDGRFIAFVRNPQVGDLWMMPATGGTPVRLTDEAAEIRGWDWMPNGKDIVFGRRVDSESRLYQLDVHGRTLRDLGLDDALSPVVARAAGTLAFVKRHPQFSLFRVPLGNASIERRRLFPSSGRDSQPMVAPDGRQIVFTSDRSGAYALWWADLGDETSLRLIEGVRPETRQAPDWSVDSRQVLVTGRDEQGVPGIYEVLPVQGHWKRLPVPVEQPLQALYVPGQPDRILVVERRDGEKMYLSLFDRSQSPWRRVSMIEGVSQARVDAASGRILYTRLAAGGLWSVGLDLATPSVTQISPDRPTRWRYRTWVVTAQGDVDYLSNERDCATAITRLNVATRRDCLDADSLSTLNGFSVAPSGDVAYVALAESDGTDIAVMELRKNAHPVVLGVAKWLPRLGKVGS